MKQFQSINLIRNAVLVSVVCGCCTAPAIAQKTDDANSSAIAATVNEKTISVGQVNRALSKSIGKLKLNETQTLAARKATLEQIINQHVVLAYLETHQSGAGKNQVIEKLDELKAELATVDKTLEQYLEQTGKTQPELEFEFAWQLAWQKYLDQKLSDEKLEAHFNNHQRRFDGTELRVAHLLLKHDSPGDKSDHSKLVATANDIRISIQSAELSWEQAVEKHSKAPTRESAGVIGWIKRSGPMPKSFTNAAFGLNLNEVSNPVVTTFGVHLIKCVEIKTGKTGWRDNIKAVRADAMRVIFDTIKNQHREKTKIEYGAALSE